MPEIFNLKCNHETAPIGIDRKARFTWNVAGTQMAFALRIFAGDSPVYDSGRVAGSQTVFTVIRMFLPLTEHEYELTVFAEEGTTAARGRFRTALTGGFDARAQWIGMPERLPNGENGNPATYYRKRFTVHRVAPTFAYCCGLGLFELRVNGVKAGDCELDCPFTDYDRSLFYRAYEITELLAVGENEIEIALGDGWYNQTTIDEWNFHRAPWRDDHKLIFQTAGGVSLFSDETWECSYGVIAASALRLGEHVDLNRKPSWRRGGKAEPPRGVLRSADFEPIRVCARLPARSVTQAGGVLLADFGENIAGFLSFRGELKRGQCVVFRYGDRLTDGRIDNASNAQYLYNKAFSYQEDSVISDRDGVVSFRPKFVYHGFRWVEIEGLDRPLAEGELTALSVHSDLEETARFSCDLPLVNRLYRMCVASVRANFVGIPTDCPHREKNGWTGDVQLSSDWLFTGFDCDLNCFKWLEDIADSQLESGKLPCIVPTGGWGYDWGNGPAWDFALFRLVECFLRYRGDDAPAKLFCGAMEQYFSYLESRAEGDLVEVGLGDWNYPKKIPVAVAPTKLTDSCYYLRMAEILSEISARGDYYAGRAERIRTAIAREWIASDGTVANGGMTALAAVLYFHVADGASYRAILEKLIEKAECGRYEAGILGVKMVNRVLCENGRFDLVLRLLCNTEYPSFGNWAERGAVSFWEDFEGTNSRNHHMFCDVAAILLQYGLGIRWEGNSLTVEPALRQFGRLEGQVRIPNGTVALSCETEGGAAEIRCTVPPGVRAVLIADKRRFPLSEGANHLNITL